MFYNTENESIMFVASSSAIKQCVVPVVVAFFLLLHVARQRGNHAVPG